MPDVEDRRCSVPNKRGWHCVRPHHPPGECVSVPKWWNWRGWSVFR